MMNQGNQQLPMYSYFKECAHPHPLKNIYSYHNVYALESVTDFNTGFLRLNIVNQVDKTHISNATIRLNVTDGTNQDIPIMYLITSVNPVRIELPMANELGIQMVGSLYNFSTYNLRVDAFGYFSTSIPDIHLFPDLTTNLYITMIPTSAIQTQLPIEEMVEIIQHPRDVMK